MAKKTKVSTPDLSTEDRIKEAARTVFTRKGYAATRTRDIAEEAGLNLALLNYYFRSKEKLFEIVMREKIQKFFGVLSPILNDSATTLDDKIKELSGRYIGLLSANPDLPLFILSEVRNNPHLFVKIVPSKLMRESVLVKQMQALRPDINPVQLIISLLGMCVFPFAMKPILQKLAELSDDAFNTLMNERRTLIPSWMNVMLHPG